MVIDLRAPVQRGRENLDEQATKLVLGVYRESCRKRADAAFDAALRSYMSRYPHINKELAGHAVAHILATAET